MWSRLNSSLSGLFLWLQGHFLIFFFPDCIASIPAVTWHLVINSNQGITVMVLCVGFQVAELEKWGKKVKFLLYHLYSQSPGTHAHWKTGRNVIYVSETTQTSNRMEKQFKDRNLICDPVQKMSVTKYWFEIVNRYDSFPTPYVYIRHCSLTAFSWGNMSVFGTKYWCDSQDINSLFVIFSSKDLCFL